jgi:hypothetical protein
VSDFDQYGAVVGRAAELLPQDEPIAPPLISAPVHPLVSLEELERPSPKGSHPDHDYPELDTRDLLYIPRYLLRRWGAEKFLRSPYYKLWEAEAGRSKRIADPKPVRK